MHNVLFIGGPLDGRREAFKTLVTFHAHPIMPKMDYEKLLKKDAPMYHPMEVFTYKFCHFNEYNIYIPQDADPMNVMKILIARYPLPLPV